MKILVVAATQMEVARFMEIMGGDVDVLIGGVGMVATTYHLSRKLAARQYDLVIQAGVAGCYNRDYELGTVVWVTSDRFGDLGAEDHDKFLDLPTLGLMNPDEFPFEQCALFAPDNHLFERISLKKVSGVTVNTVSGGVATIDTRAAMGCDIESMEGAAFHYVCLHERIPFVQVRSLSNYVEPRDRSKWRMKEAIVNLNSWLIGFVRSLK